VTDKGFQLGYDLSPEDQIALGQTFLALLDVEGFRNYQALLADMRLSAALQSVQEGPERHVWWQGYIAALQAILEAPARYVAEARRMRAEQDGQRGSGRR